MTAYSIQRANVWKTWLLMMLFIGLIIGLSFVFAQALRNPSILYGGVIFAVSFNILTYWFSDRWVMALNGAREVGRGELPEVERLLENLAITAGLPVTPKLYLIESEALNAFATGRDPKHAAVAVTSGIVARLKPRELEGVLAHELSHVRHYDTRLMVVAGVLAGIVAILAQMFIRLSWWGGGRRDDREGGNGFIIIIAFVLALLAPLFAQLLQLAISRKREFMADSGAVILTRNPDALADALERLAGDDKPLTSAAPATSHLFIVNPFKKSKGFVAWMGNLFATHPPIEERVRALRGMGV